MDGYQTISVQDSGNGVYTVTMNRPDRFNALTAEMGDELLDAYTRLAAREPRAVILTGAGRAFCAGADLLSELFQGAGQAQIAEQVGETMRQSFNPMLRAFHALPCPTIARVNGVAAGGGASMALLADIVIAARSARFIFPFAPRLGLVPDLSVTWTLPRLASRARARGLVLLGEPLDATTAAEWGLIWQAVDDADLDTVVAGVVSKLASAPTEALARTAALLDAGLDSSLAYQLDRERVVQTQMAARVYVAEGIAAFAEKREPRFRDR
ncbi:MAG TPA: enoyl-CoA hydratase-related protein [Ktedonobacterales bacterium]